MTEYNRVWNFHHGRFNVKREQNSSFATIFKFFFIEVAKRFLAHEHWVDDFAILKRNFWLKNNGFTRLGDQFHFHVTRTVKRHRLFTVVEVAFIHVWNVSLWPLFPLAHWVRVFFRVIFYCGRRTAVRVTFTQYRVYSWAEAFAVTSFDWLLFFSRRVFRIIRKRITFRLKFLDTRC